MKEIDETCRAFLLESLLDVILIIDETGSIVRTRRHRRNRQDAIARHAHDHVLPGPAVTERRWPRQ